MDERRPNQAKPATRDRGDQPPPPPNPAEHARRELVHWCQAHGLPVPPERRSSPGR